MWVSEGIRTTLADTITNGREWNTTPSTIKRANISKQVPPSAYAHTLRKKRIASALLCIFLRGPFIFFFSFYNILFLSPRRVEKGGERECDLDKLSALFRTFQRGRPAMSLIATWGSSTYLTTLNFSAETEKKIGDLRQCVHSSYLTRWRNNLNGEKQEVGDENKKNDTHCGHSDEMLTSSNHKRQQREE